MSMVINGIELSDEQLAAIVPVINKFAQKTRINKKQMEEECLAAMKEAGCPLLPTKD
ncbi:hypothetical protein [Chromobacterium haemolyticum]|uniref:hypothetical protein n=1 Tax=Chromobacterium haemolyticum TaxID=394935 RepID=UPI002446C70B|nr:hypothetical protein [Chromobacterium haemolyticum]MDH0342119.1 hypothetical protein [Chromobacterium haemolyticum]